MKCVPSWRIQKLKILKEGDEHGVGDIMKEIWVTDKKGKQQQFKGDQANNSKVVRLVIVC